jgi:membrane protease YdiL (CAAX protease family)
MVVALTVPALGVAWLVHQGCGWVLDRLGVSYDSQAAVEAVRAATAPAQRAVLFLFAVVMAPIVEEILFRGILWPLLRDRGWHIWGALLAALAFAAIHFNLPALVPLWLLGIFWTWLYERTGDLMAPIVSHGVFNAVNFLWLILSDPGSGP